MQIASPRRVRHVSGSLIPTIDALDHVSDDRSPSRSYGDWMPARKPKATRRVTHVALQYGRFGVVGAAATALHAGTFAALIELVDSPPLIANAIAFSIAVPISFFGHRHWTFHASGGDRGARLAMRMISRFVLVALLGVCLNSLVVYVVTGPLTLPYAYAIPLMVSVVPMTVFVLSKLWAFA
jgi:putative flippase GtrA